MNMYVLQSQPRIIHDVVIVSNVLLEPLSLSSERHFRGTQICTSVQVQIEWEEILHVWPR